VNLAEVQVMGILFFATAFRSALGFGEALIAVPLLAMLMPVEVAAPLSVLVSITVALLAVAQDWREIHAQSAKWLVLSTFFGIPLGLLLLKTAPEAAVKTGLGVLIIAFAVYSVQSGHRHHLKNDRLAWLFGFSAGVLGGAYGMNGPPLVVFGTLRRWTPVRFRATLQGYFLPASMVGMFGYLLAGLWTPAVNRHFLYSLPVVLAAAFLGRAINRRLDRQPGRLFLLSVHAALALVGAALLWQARRG
jgi:hypothetical protein